MGRLNETVRTVNSAVRTVLFAALLAGAGLGGWKAYSLYNEPQKKLDAKQRELEELSDKLATASEKLGASEKQNAALAADVEAKKAAIAKLETSIGLLKLRHRIARLHVVDQDPIADSDRVRTTVEFFEVNEEGAPVDDRRQRIEIEGDRVYVECLIAKFDDKYIEDHDLERGTAICMFQRIFGEYQEPKDGFAIDQQGSSPTSYARGGEMSNLEQRIWRDFWTFAKEPEKAAELGIRAAHADAPSIEVVEGGVYEVELRTTGEITLRLLTEPSTEGDAAKAQS